MAQLQSFGKPVLGAQQDRSIDLGRHVGGVELQGAPDGCPGTLVTSKMARLPCLANVHLGEQSLVDAILGITLDALLEKVNGLIRAQKVGVRTERLRRGLGFVFAGLRLSRLKMAAGSEEPDQKPEEE